MKSFFVGDLHGDLLSDPEGGDPLWQSGGYGKPETLLLFYHEGMMSRGFAGNVAPISGEISA